MVRELGSSVAAAAAAASCLLDVKVRRSWRMWDAGLENILFIFHGGGRFSSDSPLDCLIGRPRPRPCSGISRISCGGASSRTAVAEIGEIQGNFDGFAGLGEIDEEIQLQLKLGVGIDCFWERN